MNQLVELLSSLVTWPTIIPLITLMVGVVFLLLSLFFSVEHIFAGALHFNVVDVNHEISSVNNNADFNLTGFLLGIKSRVPSILYVILTSILMLLMLYNVGKLYTIDNVIFSIVVKTVSLIFSLIISSRISYFILRPIGKFMDDNSGEVIKIQGVVGKIEYINTADNFVRVETDYLGHKDVLTVYLLKREVEKAQIGEDVIIVSKEEDKDGNIIFNGSLMKNI